MAKKKQATAAQVETAPAIAVAEPAPVAATPAPTAAPAPAKASRKKAATENPPAADTTPAPAPAAPTKPKVPGVALLATRPFIAGEIIKRHGLAAGVTDAMVAELDKLYAEGRKPNPVQSKFDLQSAWHALRGFTGWMPDAK